MQPLEIRAMTFNIRHGLGMDRTVSLDNIAAVVQQSKADIIGLQEVDRFFSRSGTQHQPAELAQQLGMEYCFSASEDAHNSTRLAGLIRDSDAETGKQGGYGNALLSRFPIVSHRRYYLKDQQERRSLLEARLDVKGNPITVFVTHLSHLDPKVRGTQIDTIKGIINNTVGDIILMGDFNIKTGNPLLSNLPPYLPKIPLAADIMTFVGNDREKSKQIDHIFTNLASVKPAWTLPTTASDHHPFLAQLRLNSD